MNTVFNHPVDAIRFVLAETDADDRSHLCDVIRQVEDIKSGRTPRLLPTVDLEKYLDDQCETYVSRAVWRDQRLSAIETLYETFGQQTVFLPVKNCSKRPVLKKWPKVRFRDTCHPAYAKLLLGGNISILQGDVSQHLVSIDVDDDEDFAEFLSLNPHLRESVMTSGARGKNLWVRMLGPYPPLSVVHRRGSQQGWGEFRSAGGQTIVDGMHPSLVPYSIASSNQSAGILEVAYADILWPDSVVPPHETQKKNRMSRKNSRSGKNHRNLVAGDREVDRIKAEFDMVAFVRELGFEITLSESGGMICCPFHDDRTPSCWVQPDHFFCFGCEAVGDVFEFLKRLRNLPFRNSLIYIKSCLARGFCRLT